MIEVIFQFPTSDALWAFRVEALADFVDMDKDRNLLICRCLPQHLELARSKYQAVVWVSENAEEGS